jgi:putative N6-adenine-specific DNA methylase
LGMPAPPPLALFASTAPGLEAVTLGELASLGMSGAAAEPGGVAFRGGPADVARANLWLRTASRVVVRAASFEATTFYELERRARQVPWERYASAERPVRFRVTCRKSRLYHSDAVAERLAAALDRRVGGGVAIAHGGGGADDADAGDASDDDAQLFVVRLFRDRCTVSADSSGALLHRRGYRQAVAKAPVRETLAAAMLAGAGWAPDAPLLDPLCGSGTVAIEAALLARRIAPGLGRRFAFMRWPEFDERDWTALVDEARTSELARAPAPIQGSDRDEGAVAAAAANARRAAVEADVELSVRPLSAVAPPAGPGWVVTNPPYGVRVGERDRLRNLYLAFGNVLRARCPGWTAALLLADRQLESHLRLELREAFATSNGGIPVRLAVGRVE